ncbi:hypothetical protein BDF20DRAFT_841805 [Mycotypha africana]|uniref:uncharacterized protein n=1 Tax=Mycotypha africana TaxID=64632 RepID=UPI0023006FB4|nr:uncharacterized protein BDF20DRAFT_841805 [Mycotypha africana]KAI8990947.1 hypothetical protein BDF20DRAFT_841805 [Mycotypha africana]
MSSFLHEPFSSAYLIPSHMDENNDTQQQLQHEQYQDKDQLWQIIENQRTIINELNEALKTVKLERDSLILKLENLTAAASRASSTPSPPTPTPTPPPRSPFRNVYLYQHSSGASPQLPHHQQQHLSKQTQQRQASSSIHDTINYFTAEEQDEEDIQSILTLATATTNSNHIQDRIVSDSMDEGTLVQLKISKISLHASSSSFVLSVLNPTTGEELWQIEKAFLELIALDTQLKSLNSSVTAAERNYQDLINVEQLLNFCNTSSTTTATTTALEADTTRKLKLLIEAYFDQILNKLDTQYPFYSFITTNYKIQKEGYLTRRESNDLSSKRTFYFILQEKEIRYFTTNQGKLFSNHINLLHSTQIVQQQQKIIDKKEANDEEHAFIIFNTNEQPIVLSAPTQCIRDEWVDVLYTFITSLQKQSQQRFNKTNSQHLIKTAAVVPKLHKHPQLQNQTKKIVDAIDNHSFESPQHEQQHSHQLRHRVSLDDQAILKHYKSNNNSVASFATIQTIQTTTNISNNSSRNINTNSINDNQTLTDSSNCSRKNGYSNNHRKSFWSRQGNKLLSLAASPFTNSSTKVNNGTSSSNSSINSSNKQQQIFGVSIEEALNVSSITVQPITTTNSANVSSNEFRLPSIVYRCIEYLDTFDAIYEEGIYRLSGSASQLSQLKQQFFEQHGDVNLLLAYNTLDVHVVAGLLKSWLRELPINILTEELLDSFRKVSEISDPIYQLEQLHSLVCNLPLPNYALLYTLIQHLKKIVQNAQHNRMTLHNLSIVFAPTLSIPTAIFQLFMTEFESIFTPATTQFILQQERQNQQLQQLQQLQQQQKQQETQQENELMNKKIKRKSQVVSFLPSSTTFENATTTSADKIKQYYLSKLQ